MSVVADDQRAEARLPERHLRGERPSLRIHGRTVILVNDVLATVPRRWAAAHLPDPAANLTHRALEMPDELLREGTKKEEREQRHLQSTSQLCGRQERG
jgi:hypothetical protein